MAHPARLTSHLLARQGTAFPAGGFGAAKIALAQPAPSARATAFKARMPEPDNLPPEPDRQRSPRADNRVKMTVRLDPDQHRRLRLSAALRRCTSQEVMIRALDAYIETCGSACACMREVGSPHRQN